MSTFPWEYSFTLGIPTPDPTPDPTSGSGTFPWEYSFALGIPTPDPPDPPDPTPDPTSGSSTFPWTFPIIWGGGGAGFDIELPPSLRTPGPRLILSNEQIVSLHTAQGVQLYQFLADDQIEMQWTRELRETSVCDLTVPSALAYDRLSDITPWIHWISVWDATGQDLYWTGPIQRVEANRDTLLLSARDMSALAARTRCPLVKRWEAADPAEIAGELWAAMIELHGLQTKAIERRDPRGDRFDFATEADTSMVDDVIGDLTDLGLYWSVVAGVPLLGPAPTSPIAALGVDDFVSGGLTVIRDGANTYNDVLLRAADNLARARVRMGGLNLQTTVTIDSMFGVANTERAVQQLARYAGTMHDAVTVPSGAVLHPNAPVTIGQLIPSVRINIDAYGLLAAMELSGVTVTVSSGVSTVGITLESVTDDLPELLTSEGVTLT